MNFVISSNDLNNHLQSLVKVINTKNTLPALDNFLFSLKENELTITASDLDTTLTTVIELSNTQGEGTIGIDARRLLSTVKGFNEPLTFNINTENFNIDIISEKGKYSLVGITGDEYPEIPALSEDTAQSVTMTSEIFVTSINSTLFAASSDEMRPVMTGIYYGFSPEFMVVAASDSHKLVRYKRTDVNTESEFNFILPPKPAGLIKSLFTKDDTPVEILLNAQIAQIKFSTYTLTCRLIEGNYPNFESIIPKNQPYKLSVDRNNLQSVLKRVSLYSNPAVQLIRIDLEGTEVNVSAQDLDFSISANERINCTYEGENMTIGFKATCLQDILSTLPGTETQIELSEASKAALLLPSQKENEFEDILMLLMPVMI